MACAWPTFPTAWIRPAWRIVGLVSADIGPLWRDTKHFTHRIVGIAVTAGTCRPTSRDTDRLKPDEFNRWVGEWYTSRSPEPFVPLLREGSVLVIEEAPDADVGSIGSNNIMSWKAARLRGRGHQRHGPRHGRDHRAESAAVFSQAGPRHPAGPQ